MSHQESILEGGKEMMIERAHDPEKAIPAAVMRYVEGMADDAIELSGVTIGYGYDRQMHAEKAHMGYPDEWWETFPPIEGRRFRVFIPREADGSDAQLVTAIDDIMAAIGATKVGVYPDDDADSYDHRGRDSHHYLLPDNSPIHNALGAKVDL